MVASYKKLIHTCKFFQVWINSSFIHPYTETGTGFLLKSALSDFCCNK